MESQTQISSCLELFRKGKDLSYCFDKFAPIVVNAAYKIFKSDKANITETTKEEPATPAIDLSAVITDIRDENKTKCWITASELHKGTLIFARLINETTLLQINKFISENNKRKLSYKDIAALWFAFKHTCLKNEDRSSPQVGIIGLSKSIVRSKVIDAAPDFLHCSVCIKYFIALKLCRITKEPQPGSNGKKGQATCYEIINNEYGI